MYHYNVHMRSKGFEYCGGQNLAHSRAYMLWINERASKKRGTPLREFVYDIGHVDNRTGVISLINPPKYPASMQADVTRFLEIITRIYHPNTQ